ncbi:MAG: hypothetical protein Q4B60_08910 [Erysipelotrichaceae bacterium]|nr:hypothetical protein [Erysipelotrichaceae bacterium]
MKKIIICILCLLFLCACTASKPKINTEKTDAEKLKEHLVNYNHQNVFTVNAPGTWEVSTGSYNMFYWIHLYDPAEPNLQVFTLIKASNILKNQQAKDYYTWAYNLTGNDFLYGPAAGSMVLSPPTVENFYLHFMDYCAFLAKYDVSYQGFDYPQISEFETIESFDVTNFYSSAAIDNKLIHASFTNPLTQGKGEGLFMGTVTNGLVMMDPGYDCGSYFLYNITGISAPYGMFNEYKEILMGILGSISYSDQFIQSIANDLENNMNTASQINQIMQETTSIVVDGWNQRQKTYDVISQKYSDATLGYERVRDINDHDKIYKAYNGFLDSDLGSNFEAIPDDDYSKDITAYIIK